jgi:ABC-2 type transport system ATP-binding protein
MLEARGLTKNYASIPALDNASFTAEPGQILGYLGPNGSGKSTTVNILTGLLEPSRGEVLFEGKPIQDQLIEYKRRLGYVPEEPHVYPYLSGYEYLELAGRLREIPERLLKDKIEGLLRLFGLSSSRHSAISSYSKGMKQKVLISGALLHNPDVLIFDEPLSGLDVTSALVFRNLLTALANEGKTILYSSHVLEVVERVCSRVIILYRGKVVANDSVTQLRSLMSLPSLEQIFSQLVVQEDTSKTASEILEVMKY